MESEEGATSPPPGSLGGRVSGVTDAAVLRAKWAERGAFAAPLMLILGLALAGGGFGVSDRHVAGILIWLVVIGLVVLGVAASAVIARPFLVTGGLITALAAFTALSSLWSASVERSVIEADRVLVYLGVFAAAFLIAQPGNRRRRFIEGLALGLAAVAVLALASRILPDVVSVSTRTQAAIGAQARLAYPLGYWNADGAIFGLTAVLLLWMARDGSHRALRWVGVGALPAVLLALYFTYSRGGVLTLAVGLICLLALSHQRLWHLASFALALAVTVPVMFAVQARHSLADGLGGGAAASQGLVVLLFLLLATAVYVGGRSLLVRVEARPGRTLSSVLGLSRDRRLLGGIAATALVVVAVLAIVLGGRAWRQFTSPDLKFPNSAASHFTDVEGAGRYDYWRVAIKGFDQNPIAGNGAGTYQFLWDRYRKIRVPVGTPNTVTTARDAHSLYIETLAELGIIGALLVLGLVGSVLFIGFSAWRHAPDEEREGAAALVAVVLAFAVAAGFDWLWEVADVGAVFFLAAGVLAALACSERDPRPARPGNGQRRYGLAVAGVVIGWITVVALIGPLIVDRELASSRAALDRGDLSSAQDHAQTARDVEPWAASPYVQLDLVAEAKRDYATARERISEAIDREPDNWQLWVIRSRVEKAAGLESAARRDETRAEQLNPFASDVIRQTIRATKAPARG